MDWSGCPQVEVIPGKVSGVPLVKGSRVQADAVLENFEAGQTPEKIAWNFDLNPESVRALLAFACARQTTLTS